MNRWIIRGLATVGCTAGAWLLTAAPAAADDSPRANHPAATVRVLADDSAPLRARARVDLGAGNRVRVEAGRRAGTGSTARTTHLVRVRATAQPDNGRTTTSRPAAAPRTGEQRGIAARSTGQRTPAQRTAAAVRAGRQAPAASVIEVNARATGPAARTHHRTSTLTVRVGNSTRASAGRTSPSRPAGRPSRTVPVVSAATSTAVCVALLGDCRAYAGPAARPAPQTGGSAAAAGNSSPAADGPAPAATAAARTAATAPAATAQVCLSVALGAAASGCAPPTGTAAPAAPVGAAGNPQSLSADVGLAGTVQLLSRGAANLTAAGHLPSSGIAASLNSPGNLPSSDPAASVNGSVEAAVGAVGIDGCVSAAVGGAATGCTAPAPSAGSAPADTAAGNVADACVGDGCPTGGGVAAGSGSGGSGSGSGSGVAAGGGTGLPRSTGTGYDVGVAHRVAAAGSVASAVTGTVRATPERSGGRSASAGPVTTAPQFGRDLLPRTGTGGLAWLLGMLMLLLGVLLLVGGRRRSL